MTPDAQTFDISEVVTSRQLSIAASAGTGKTFTLASLAVRCVAVQDIAASQLLIVTFTRAATNELRARVRARMVEAVQYLAHEVPPDSNDELFTYLALEDRTVRRERLERAIQEFDAATITTIHGFASQVLSTLGSAADIDVDAGLQSNEDDMRAAACSDILATAAGSGHLFKDLPGYQSLVEATKIAGGLADVELIPSAGDGQASVAARLKATLVHRALDDMATRRAQAGVRSFNDLLLDLRSALTSSGRDGPATIIRERYKVALIDEFQDTDSVQWDIFHALFVEGAPEIDLVLVGDPKQAIYAFRGANVHTYLVAIDQAIKLSRRSLGMNWRADGVVVDSLRVLLGGATFGDPRIGFATTSVAPEHAPRRMTIRGVPAPALSIRLALGEDIPRSDRGKNPILTPKARVAVYGDMVLQIRQLLDHGTIPDENKEGVDRKITPADIAVLVRTRNESAAVQAALIEQGVPAVQARGVSVLESRAAEQWRTLLWALTNPSDPRRARALALTWFGGWTADQVAVATDEQLTDLQETMQTWSTTLDLHGVTAFVRQIWSESGIAQVVLSGPEGDRHMTDLQHVGELLAQSARLERIGVAGLLALLDVEPESEIDVEGDGDTTARRIESEARAVQVMTVWVAKGLEFPIVCCPTLWGSPRAPATVFIDPVTGIRTFDVANNEEWPDKASAEERKGWARHEALGEQLRLLYVALTRARHHTIVWWSRCQSSEGTALARVLFARSGGAIDPDRFNDPKVDLPDDDDAWGELQPLQHLSEGTIDIGLHGMPLPPAGRWKDPERSLAQPPLELARLERALDRARRRWSFTALTSHAETFTADPSDESLGDGGADDERADDEVETTGQEGDPTQEDPVAGGGTGVGAWPALAQLPAGAGFGTLVHSVLERVDFSAPDLAADLGREVERAHRRAPLDLTPVPDAVGDESTGEELLVRGLMDALQAPLGPPMADLRLIDLTPSQRINEMSFELQLGEHTARPDLRAIGRLVAEGLEPGDPFVEWARALAAGAIVTPLAGHLTGSVDLIFRVPHGEAAGRFVVADYKTNRLSQRGQAPRPGDYQRDGLARAMVEHHYPLQALLYSVVLHRYLSWRLAGYAPEAHLSGAAYLFVRGMGPHDPSTAAASAQPGIFHWNIPPHLVVALSDLLNGMHQWAGAS